MDEIDAALDFKNVSIVAGYIYVRINPLKVQLVEAVLNSKQGFYSEKKKKVYSFFFNVETSEC